MINEIICIGSSHAEGGGLNIHRDKKTIDWYLENRDWVEQITNGSYNDYYTKMYSNR